MPLSLAMAKKGSPSFAQACPWESGKGRSPATTAGLPRAIPPPLAELQTKLGERLRPRLSHLRPRYDSPTRILPRPFEGNGREPGNRTLVAAL